MGGRPCSHPHQTARNIYLHLNSPLSELKFILRNSFWNPCSTRRGKLPPRGPARKLGAHPAIWSQVWEYAGPLESMRTDTVRTQCTQQRSGESFQIICWSLICFLKYPHFLRVYKCYEKALPSACLLWFWSPSSTSCWSYRFFELERTLRNQLGGGSDLFMVTQQTFFSVRVRTRTRAPGSCFRLCTVLSLYTDSLLPGECELRESAWAQLTTATGYQRSCLWTPTSS